MSERDPQTIVLSRPSILLVTGVSVGLLTLCYVLGVQVGKQSAALRASSTRGSGEALEELPAPIQEQLKALEAGEFPKPTPPPKPAPKPETPNAEPPKPDAPKPDAPRPEAPKPVAPKPPEPTKPETAPAVEPGAAKWTVQLVSTPDPDEAERVTAKAKAAGFSVVMVKDKGMFKVRLAKPRAQEEMSAQEEKLKAKGFKTYLFKVD